MRLNAEEFLNLTSDKEWQFENALLPIETMVLGINTDLILLFSKAPSVMPKLSSEAVTLIQVTGVLLIFDGMTTCSLFPIYFVMEILSPVSIVDTNNKIKKFKIKP